MGPAEIAEGLARRPEGESQIAEILGPSQMAGGFESPKGREIVQNLIQN